jgi:nucleotide-binding universal stress UspA family protein
MTESTGSEAELQNPPDDPKNILVAVDASAGVPRVIDMAARMSRAMPSAAVHVIHVFRQSRLDKARAGAPVPSSSDAIEDAREHLGYQVRQLRRRCRADVTGHFVLGDPATEVLRKVVDLDADLLVVGTHDNVGFERLLLGSIAETLMRKAGCPILVVRPKSHK